MQVQISIDIACVYHCEFFELTADEWRYLTDLLVQLKKALLSNQRKQMSILKFKHCTKYIENRPLVVTVYIH